MTVKNPDQIKKRVQELLPELKLVKNEQYRKAIVEIWAEIFIDSDWDHFEDVPKSSLVQKYSNVQHTRSVTLQAYETAKILESIHGFQVDYDVLITASLLHDVSKMIEYSPSGTTKFGKLMQHAVYGVHKAFEKNLPIEVSHLIVSHTHASKVMTRTIEAIILHYVDYLDSDALLLDEDKPLLLKK
jgi:putative nucleotidyltransferase with HDIG domain